MLDKIAIQSSHTQSVCVKVTPLKFGFRRPTSRVDATEPSIIQLAAPMSCSAEGTPRATLAIVLFVANAADRRLLYSEFNQPILLIAYKSLWTYRLRPSEAR